MTNTMVAETILQQLGGNRFAAMTGAKNFVALENGIKFSIGRNVSKANMVKITVNSSDLYDVEFIKYTPYKFRITKNGEFKETKEKSVTVEKLNGYYSDMLQDGFTRVTGMYTHL